MKPRLEWDTDMDREMVAKELSIIAKELLAIDFPSKEAMDSYFKEHPNADRSNHRVVSGPGKKKGKVSPGSAKKLLSIFGGQIEQMRPENIEEMVERGYFKEGAVEATIEEHERLKKTNSRKADEYLDDVREALESANSRLFDEKLAERKERERRPWRR